jgi:hypothetical protein
MVLKMPAGMIEGGRPKVAVRFTSVELFEKIKQRAEKSNKGFSEQVSELCEVGLLDLDDLDASDKSAA